MLSCSSRMKIGSSSRVNMYRGTWQGLETANFFPLGSHLYCIAKRRLSSIFFCKESISGPRQIPATLLLCPVRCLCCYRSEGFWFVMSYVESCVKGHCCWFFVCGIECMDCSRKGGVWACSVQLLEKTVGHGQALGWDLLCQELAAPPCPIMPFCCLWVYSLVRCMCRRKWGCVLGSTKKQNSLCVLCSGLEHRRFGEVVTGNDVPGEGSTRLQHPSCAPQHRCYLWVCPSSFSAWCALVLENIIIIGLRFEK